MPDANGKKIYLFIGDSYTERMNKYGLIPARHLVFAKHGTAPRDWYEMTSNDKFVNFSEEVMDLNADAFDGIVYLYGINDIKCSWNVYYSKRLLRDLMMYFPKKPIYVQRVFPVPKTYSWTKHTYKQINTGGQYNVKTYNTSMKTFCDKYWQLIWTDTTKGFITSYGNMKQDKSDDGLHISEAAYPDFWANICSSVPGVK